jgi:hypothetical protein
MTRSSWHLLTADSIPCRSDKETYGVSDERYAATHRKRQRSWSKNSRTIAGLR